MAEQNRLPQENQLVTVVSVREGNVMVASASVLVSKIAGIAVQLEGEPASPAIRKGQTVTLLYGHGAQVLRVKASVAEVADERRLLLEPTGYVKEGERREFLRTEARLRMYCRRVPGADADKAREAQAADFIPPGDRRFVERSVDLSGSGAKFPWNERPEKDSLLDLRLAVPLNEERLVSTVSSVVRVSPSRDVDGLYDIATRFVAISEKDQDILINFVFKSRYEAMDLPYREEDRVK